MAKQLNVNLAFTADTGKAKAQIQDLQNQLTKLVTTTNNQKFSVDLDNKGINEAISSVAELQAHLRKATNQKTGNLDFSKLNDSLKKSNKSLIEYGDSLRQLGPEGQKAFQTLVSSVTSAEIPMRRVNNTLNEMWTTMKNTARWQISSSIMHGFMGSVQSAYGYAKRLDESLNNIRIVTGQNTDQMAAFAEKANKAAKALSATTTQYTDAALIYYQQGLNDQEVQDRADITIKMAHASGQSAEIVSDQLTAIWNNFYDGSESLEHYADVMTALGAATASSSDEIAGGLEKFASIADMIGLSYEYAASALATITATTRQSEDVVGTALKTIFARIQGLKLGETLDDGTDLNKYSEALQKVGISIFEQNGELKNMDNILKEMGGKWETLSKDQQVALAQTVAGVRQYNQLVSLMDHWDFMEENVALSLNSDGTLDEQADIYAESWEAASNRVRAAAEDIYDSLLDDEFFITLLNGFEDILTVIGKLIDGMGGFEGVVFSLGAILTKVFSNQLAQTLTNAQYSLTMMTSAGREKVENDRKKFLQDAMETTTNKEFTTIADKARSEALGSQIGLQTAYLDNVHRMNDVEQEVNRTLIERNKLLNEQKVKAAEIAAEADRKSKESKFDIEAMIAQNEMDLAEGYNDNDRENLLNKNITSTKEYYKSNRETAGKVYSIKSEMGKELEIMEEKATPLKQQIEYIKNAVKDLSDEKLTSLIQELEKAEGSTNDFEIALEKIKGQLNNIEQEAYDGMYMSVGTDPKHIKAIEQDIELLHEQINTHEELNEAIKDEEASRKKADDSINNSVGAQKSWADHLVNTANIIMGVSVAFQSLSSIVDTINDPNLSDWEKFTSVMMSLATAIPMVTMAFGSETFALGVRAVAQKMGIGLTVQQTAAEGAETAAVNLNTLALLKNIAIKALGNPIFWASVAAIGALVYGIKQHTDALEADSKAAEKAKEASEELKNKYEDAKTSLEGIKSAIDEYDTLVDTLEDCTKGTDEWNEALDKVKENVWDLLEQYPELAKMENLFNDDGTLNRQTVDTYLAQQEKNVANARAASVVGSANAAQLNAKSKQTDLSRDIGDVLNKFGISNGSVGGGENKGQQLISRAINSYNSDEMTGLDFDALVESYVKGLGIAEEKQQALTEELKTFADEIQNVANVTEQANTQMKNIGQTLANDILGNSATQEQKEKYAETFSQDYDEKYEQALNETKIGINKLSSADDAEVKALWEKYSQATGTNYSLDSNAVVGDDDNRYFQYLNEEGITVKISAEELATAIATADAQSEATDKVVADAKKEMNGLGYQIKEGVDPELVVALGNQMNFNDETTRNAIASILNNAETIAEQEEEIRKLIDNLTEEQKQDLESKELISDASQKYDLDSEVLEKQAEQLMDVYEAEELTKVQATKLAIENQRMNKGVEELVDNWEDWRKELKSGKKGTSDYAKMTTDLTKVIADLTGAAEDLELPDEFFESDENLKLIEKAAKGSEKAIAELGVAVGKTTVEMMEMEVPEGVEEFTYLGANGEELSITADEFNTYKDTVIAGIDELQSKVAEGQDLMNQSLSQILEGSGTSAAEWVGSLNEMAMATNMTVEEMNSLLSSLGLEADVDVTEKTIKAKKPRTRTTVENFSGNPLTGISYDTVTRIVGYDEVDETIQIPQIAVNDETNEPLNINYIGNGSVSPTSSKPKGGGGGGSKSKPAEKVDFTQKSEVVDRYKEIDDTLSDIEDTMSNVNKQADRLYGASRLNQMKKEKDLLLQQADALKEKKRQAEDYLKGNAAKGIKGDKQELIEVSAEYGITWDFDNEDGDILNYTSVMEGLFNELHAAEVKMDGMATKEAQDEFKTNSIEPIEEKIERIKDALSKYEDTKELLKELDNQLQEAIWAWQDKNFEELEYKLELKLEIEDTFLKELDYLMNKWSDDFFKTAKTAALMYDPDKYDQSDGYRNKLQAYGAQEDELKKQYEAGQISQAKYIEGLKKVQDGYYENLEALNELDKQMLHFYEDTLAAGAEELVDYTDHMEHLTGVFDHYLNLMDILGKTKDYEAMGDFLGGRADTLRDRLDVAKEYYDVMLNQKADVEQELNNAIRSGDEESVKFWQEQWDAIVDATDEAQEQVLSLTEEWAEAMRATIDNNMAKIKDTLEKSLTDGMGFDFLMAEFDRLNARQEEYLTKTNQIYETNKLIRQASQKIDQTDNKVAKQKMQNFVAETKALQENNQLSNYELEIQQAKYDLLLAEIALEEAQNAKSTVRMQRDSEGNFGYVYTADQDAVNDAQQGVEDAENRLYNLSLEGQQEYTEKYLQAQQEMTEALAEQWSLYYEEGTISLEEYNQRCDSIYEHYLGEGGVFQTYSNLYNVAVQTDAAATADYWGKQYGEMTQRTEEWQVAVNDYMINVEEQTEEWAKVSKQANKDVEGALKDSSTATKELTQESDKLGRMVENKVIPALEDEYEQVMENVKAYEAERDAIQEVIDTYEKRAIQLGKDIVSESEKALDDEDETTTSDSKKFRDDYAADIRDLVLNKGFDIESGAVQSLLTERQEKINSDEKWSGMSNDELIKNIEADKKKKKVTSMDTGGFTGVWGPEGKLAFLHQKELVLNEHDTDNMLNTVSMIRELVSMIDAGAAGSMISGLLSTPGFTNMLNHDFQQHVEIYAEFPDATDHSEIEQAFNNLLNTASQYANRKI